MYAPATTFEDLHVWQKAHTLVLRIYEMTAGFPRSEVFGLASQMRRSATSVPGNIAEAFGRRSPWDKARVLNIAASSLRELQYQCLLALDLHYTDDTALRESAEEVSRMLSAYERTILASARSSRRRTVILTSVFCLLYSAF